MKKIFSILLAFVFLLGLCACGNNSGEDDNGYYKQDFYEEYPTGDEIHTVKISKNPQAVVTLTDGSEIVIELRSDAAPNAVSNFIAFAKQDIYNKMGFTDVRNNCIVMTGAMDGEFSSPYYVQDELPDKEDAKLSHVRGTVSMMRKSDSDTLTGEFFVLTEDQVHFDNNFTAFGTVIEGMEHVDKIAAAEKNEDGELTAPVAITNVKVKTFGEKIPVPTIILK